MTHRAPRPTRSTLLAAVLLVGFAIPAASQSSYDRGYNSGYNDIFPSTGTPGLGTEYGKGFQAGQDDSYEDDEMEHRSLERSEREFEQQRRHLDFPDASSFDRGQDDPSNDR